MANTRRALERVPEDRLGWQPHPKSWSMGNLATHLANLPSWTNIAVKENQLDLAPGGVEPPRLPPAASRQELLQRFDENVKAARACLADASDPELLAPWTLLRAGTALFTMPKVGVLRSFVFNHIVHHRGQLTVYLRLNDVPVPSLYGPSADEAV